LTEEVITTCKAYLSDSSKVVVIPRSLRRKLGERNTDLFVLKLDSQNRIILEPIRKQEQKNQEATAQ
jgi:bifunctional DNA-binding transcriptional regulator/antitoxin component of YhaV-PrlF toxin-antitoxin module